MGKSLPVTFTGDTNLRREVKTRLTATSQTVSICD